jgi:putative DNA primase/helicase
MDFKGLASELLNNSESLLNQWLPNGKLNGHEYQVGSLQGEAGKSLSINIKTGKWADFASGDKGGDLISLYAAIKGIKNSEAVKELKKDHHQQSSMEEKGSGGGPNNNPRKHPTDIIPPPKGTKLPDFKHNKLKIKPTEKYIYRSLEGDALFIIARYDHDGDKTFTPFTYTADGCWQKKQWPAPRPLYGLEKLTDRVLIVEGERAAMAASKFAGKVYSVVTWAGGSNAVEKTDWSPLYNKKSILIWPDHDQAGRKAASQIASKLLTRCDNLKIINTQDDDLPDGWDAADCDFDWPSFKKWASSRVKPIQKPSEPPKPTKSEVAAPQPQNLTQVNVGDDALDLWTSRYQTMLRPINSVLV